jgi:hypothetical protein
MCFGLGNGGLTDNGDQVHDLIDLLYLDNLDYLDYLVYFDHLVFLGLN